MSFCGTDTSDHRLDTYRLIARVAAGYAPEQPPGRTLRGMADTMRAMVAGEPIPDGGVEYLRDFCILLSEATLQESSTPPCGGGRHTGLGGYN